MTLSYLGICEKRRRYVEAIFQTYSWPASKYILNLKILLAGLAGCLSKDMSPLSARLKNTDKGKLTNNIY